MLLKDCMTKKVETVRPEATLEEAAKKMRSLDVGSLPVCDGDRLVGMITDRDITVRADAEGRIPSQARVKEVMTKEVIWGFDDQDIRDAADLMADRQVRRLPVLNREKRLVGIVSLGDLAVDTGDKHLAGDVLVQVSEPARPNRAEGTLTCPNCGMSLAGKRGFGVYCCKGCAEDTGCTCSSEMREAG